MNTHCSIEESMWGLIASERGKVFSMCTGKSLKVGYEIRFWEISSKIKKHGGITSSIYGTTFAYLSRWSRIKFLPQGRVLGILEVPGEMPHRKITSSGLSKEGRELHFNPNPCSFQDGYSKLFYHRKRLITLFIKKTIKSNKTQTCKKKPGKTELPIEGSWEDFFGK